ncbi:MAG: ferritin-like domain-containing protein [Candidatus Poribacteria bacterium]
MTAKFNIDEIFEMAEQIERNGQSFYCQAEKIMKANSECQKLMSLLADMEVKHEKIFASMRKDILKSNKVESILNPEIDPDGLASKYLHSIVENKIFDLTKQLIIENETLESILKMAIEREKDSIIFYLGIRELISKDFGQDKVDLIIKEEMSHIVYISNELKQIAGE